MIMQMKTKFRIVTWNIGTLYTDYEKNVQIIQKNVETLNADFLCFQEFPSKEDFIQNVKSWGNFSYYTYKVCCKSHVAVDDVDVGIAVFSKYKFGETSIFDLPMIENVELIYNGKREHFHQKSFLCVQAKINDTPLSIITGHGFPFHRYNVDETTSAPVFRDVDKWISHLKKENPSSPIFLAADMNVANALQHMPFCSETMYDLFDGEATRPTGRKTDAIYVPSSVQNFEKFSKRCGFDHFIIGADIFL